MSESISRVILENKENFGKRYFVVSDVHSFFCSLKEALDQKDFSMDNEKHILVLLGDAFDRGSETEALAEFLLSLYDKKRLIYIQGNHEELLMKVLHKLSSGGDPIDIAMSYHAKNGTWQTVLDLSGMAEKDAIRFPLELVSRVMATRVYRELLPSMVNFFETKEYIFVHGWIPTMTEKEDPFGYQYNPFWREVGELEWRDARWMNGMMLGARYGITEPDKTIVCGHFHASWGHCHVDHACSEWGEDAIFTPFYSKGIIALDACTAHTKKVNCFVFDEI